MNSPLVWVGSKRWHVEDVQRLFLHRGLYELLHGDTRWVEPFAGGASVAFGLEFKRVLLNDTVKPLMNFYQRLQTGAPFCVAAHDYFQMREDFNAVPAVGHLQAERFYALNRWSFNGIWRTNRAGSFNVPPRPVLRPLPPLAVEDYARVMSQWQLSAVDYTEVILQPGDVVYADPPYDDGFTYGTSFTWDDHRLLAMWLSIHDGPVILMNKATRRVLELYGSLGFDVELMENTQRMHQSRGRTDANLEVVATMRLT